MCVCVLSVERRQHIQPHYREAAPEKENHPPPHINTDVQAGIRLRRAKAPKMAV